MFFHHFGVKVCRGLSGHQLLLIFLGVDASYSVIVETILSGHEGWVYGVHWQPAISGPDSKISQPIRLLTASMDKTMIVWEPNHDSGIKLKYSLIDRLNIHLAQFVLIPLSTMHT